MIFDLGSSGIKKLISLTFMGENIQAVKVIATEDSPDSTESDEHVRNVFMHLIYLKICGFVVNVIITFNQKLSLKNMKHCIFLYQIYEADEAGADIIFAGTPPGDFEDVKIVKVTIVGQQGQQVKMFNLALEICHKPGTLKCRNLFQPLCLK